MAKNPTSAWLRYLVNLWTIISFGVIVVDFLGDNSFEIVLGPTLAIYVGILVIYSAEKEFERWAEYYEGRHPGEIYVFCWTLLLILLVVSSFFIRTNYKLPSEVVSTYIGVISIMAFTRKSKSFFKRRRK